MGGESSREEFVAERQAKAEHKKGDRHRSQARVSQSPFASHQALVDANRARPPRIVAEPGSRKRDWLTRGTSECLSPLFGLAFAWMESACPPCSVWPLPLEYRIRY